jgi:S1-C subfamily serine protease
MRWLMAISRQSVPLLLILVAALPQSALALTASQVYEQVKDSVVVVKAYDQQGNAVGLGSGVMLPSGDIITNYHVVEAGMRYTVGRGKHTVPASPKAGDPDKDLCLLTAPGLVAEPVRLGKTARLKVGEPVYAVGAPQGLELSLSEGIVSQLRGGGPYPIIQTTVAISPGSSGGGLFNAKGELVGITTFRMKGEQSLNFALPVEWIGQIATRKNQEGPRVEAPGIPERGDRPKDNGADRGRPPVKTRFTKAANGVISDIDTGLEWYVGPDRETSWYYAKAWVEHLAVAGGGWRIHRCGVENPLSTRGRQE